MNKKMMGLKAVAAAAVFLSAGSASAMSLLSGPAADSAVAQPNGVFAGGGSFSLSSLSDVTFDLLGGGGQGGVAVSVFDAGASNPVDTFILSNRRGLSTTLDNLGTGNYTFSFVGLERKSASYSVGYSISPVPEPAEWTLMIAGLGILGAAALRKKQAF